MAGRLRLARPQRETNADWPWIVLAVGAVMAGVIALVQPDEGDPLVHMQFGDRIAAGEIPYRDFPVEYPPLALLHLVLPRLLLGNSPTPDGYQTLFSLFGLVMAAVTGVAIYWLARHGWSGPSVRDSLLVYVGLALALGPVVIWRYDIMPTMFVALALVAVAAGRPSWSGAMLGLGAATKLFPAFLGLPLFIFYVLRRRLEATLLLASGFVVAFGLVVAEAVAVAGLNAFSFLTYQDDRGVEIESLLGGIVILADAVAGTGAEVGLGFGAWQVSSPLIEALAVPRQIVEAVLLFALVAGGALSVVRDRRTFGVVQRETLVTYLAATLLLVIIVNKVLSPQYLVWLLPFIPLLGRGPALVMLAAAVLTTLIYPLWFQELLRLEPPLIVVLNVRNALLVVLFALLIVPRRSLGALQRGDVGHTADGAGQRAEDEERQPESRMALGDDDHQ